MTHDYKKQGKKNRKAGKDFEKKVQADLTKSGWITFRNTCDVEFMNKNDMIKIQKNGKEKIVYEYTNGVFKQAKMKFNPFTKRPMSLQSGFPDFLIIKLHTCNECIEPCGFEVHFVECKINEKLINIEKQKIEWIKNNLKIKSIIASKTADGKIKYENI